MRLLCQYPRLLHAPRHTQTVQPWSRCISVSIACQYVPSISTDPLGLIIAQVWYPYSPISTLPPCMLVPLPLPHPHVTLLQRPPATPFTKRTIQPHSPSYHCNPSTTKPFASPSLHSFVLLSLHPPLALPLTIKTISAILNDICQQHKEKGKEGRKRVQREFSLPCSVPIPLVVKL